jgi:hypothetical protein
MPKAEKVASDKYEHMIDDEPERDGLDYGPNDDFQETVSSEPTDEDGKVTAGDDLTPSYSQEGAGDSVDLGGENYSQDMDDKPKTAEPEPGTGENTEDADAAKDPDKKESPASKRVSEVIKQRNDARIEAARLQGVIDGQATDAKPEPAAEPKDKPILENFESYQDFTEAMADWTYEKGENAKAAKAIESEQTANQAKFGARLREGEAKHDDFKEVVNQPNLAINDTMIEAMMDADNPDEIAYHLGKNPDEAIRISSLSAAAAGREIGKLDVTLAAPAPKAEPAPKRTTNAPPPIEPVNTGAGDITRKDPNNMSMDEYVNYRTRGGKRRV